MRDWQRVYRRASFRGVRFWVEDDGDEVGRRVAVHNIVAGESPVTEDIGRLATGINVRGYLASDLADAEGLALKLACGMRGPGLLTLPLNPAMMVRCIGCRRNRRRDEAGYIAFDLIFVEAGGGALAQATGLPALRLGFATGLAGAALGLATGL